MVLGTIYKVPFIHCIAWKKEYACDMALRLGLSIILSFAFSVALLLLFFPISSDAHVSVKGYYRSNGTYVAPHVRSNPNGLKYDNYSYTPSQGLYNKTYGTRGSTWDTPTYITDPDYYLGRSLYESGSSGIQSPSYTLPTYTVPKTSAIPSYTYTPSYVPYVAPRTSASTYVSPTYTYTPS